jgi:endonuclease-3
MTTQPSFDRVFAAVKSLGTWDEIAELPLPRLKRVMKPAGLSNQKAPRVKAILSRIKGDFGEVSLDRLHVLSNEEAERYLVSLPGVGTKTAKCVLMYALGRQVLPVDTHVARLARRLGLLPEGLPNTQQHRWLETIVRPEDRYSFHVNGVAHGRYTCRSLRPRCGNCCLRDGCAEAEA